MYVLRIQQNLRINNTLGQNYLFFIEVVLFGRFKCIITIGRMYFGTSDSVPYREVFYTVSLLGRVHYRRFHCTWDGCVPICSRTQLFRGNSQFMFLLVQDPFKSIVVLPALCVCEGLGYLFAGVVNAYWNWLYCTVCYECFCRSEVQRVHLRLLNVSKHPVIGGRHFPCFTHW